MDSNTPFKIYGAEPLFNRGKSIKRDVQAWMSLTQNDMPLTREMILDFKDMKEKIISDIECLYQDTLRHINRCSFDLDYAKKAFDHAEANRQMLIDPNAEDCPF